MKLKRSILRHVTIHLSTIKDKMTVLNVTAEKQLIAHKGLLYVRLSAYFAAETLKVRKEWDDISH